ncbi:NAD(P)/FAD-dependent oxidoreductase [Gordonia sp. TBRC 11910]|uniref:NAD(P)/FAD-dependent oxidoreductase n=1 Tax=Gordonia asplenii TaxID=2725283 RepID=A0A848KXG3_9ACTN|nr:NAD(P)/FAD-dependent oxidoreductase [Gordonia asplenii]NMO02932.1 NAD(P)/FAD-dependent oxidoreductase [Gordonia asplenii]
MSQETAKSLSSTSVDAVVVGAGFGGLRMAYELIQRGLTVKVIEAAADVGGTWYWNSYPGARTDSESWTYAYSFSEELQNTWDWTEKFPTQREVYRYLGHVADLFDVRRHIDFNTRIVAARFDEAQVSWTLTTDTGRRIECTYLVLAVGLLSQPFTPEFDGIEDFAGQWHVTGRWPRDHEVDFAGKRVAVIGTGASGIQAIPLIAQAAEKLTVFQRTPNYVLPARNHSLADLERQGIRAHYDDIWQTARTHPLGYAFDRPRVSGNDVTDSEFDDILERGWEVGGFRFLYETFNDTTIDENVNARVSEFVRHKIRTIVTDPDTAELLCPTAYPIGSKRPPLGHFYYETFNRPNVELVDVSSEPISAITRDGVRVGSSEYPADVIVFATGFDAATGAFDQIDIRGRGGRTLREHWSDGPRTHLGITIDGFPNMFMISGPQSPFGNIPVVIETTVGWIADTVDYARQSGIAALEPTQASVNDWWQVLQDYVNRSLMTRGRHSWFLGANIPGKPQGVLFFFGGVGNYRKRCRAVAENDYAEYLTQLSDSPESWELARK